MAKPGQPDVGRVAEHARKNVDTLGVDAAVLQLATHCWFEGGIEGYDRGQRDARGHEGAGGRG